MTKRKKSFHEYLVEHLEMIQSKLATAQINAVDRKVSIDKDTNLIWMEHLKWVSTLYGTDIDWLYQNLRARYELKPNVEPIATPVPRKRAPGSGRIPPEKEEG